MLTLPPSHTWYSPRQLQVTGTGLTHSYPGPGGGFRTQQEPLSKAQPFPSLPALSHSSGQQPPQAGAPQGTAHLLNPCAHSFPRCRVTLQETDAKIPPPVPGQQLLKKGEGTKQDKKKKKFLIQVEVPPSFTLEKRNFWEVIFQEPVYLSARLIAGNSCSVNHLQKDHRSRRGWCCCLLQRNST